MALSDPQVLSIASVSHNLPRIQFGPPESLFREIPANPSVDPTYELRIRNSESGSRTKRNVKFTVSVVSPNYITNVNGLAVANVNFSVDFPKDNTFALASIDAYTDAICAYLGGSSTVAPKIWAGES